MGRSPRPFKLKNSRILPISFKNEGKVSIWVYITHKIILNHVNILPRGKIK